MEAVPFPSFPTFEWDDTKRQSNLQKHNIDFVAAAAALLKPHVQVRSDREGETRTLAICPDTHKLIAVVYTMRGETCRIISARAARKHEQREYRQIYG
ncbi:BrnT family toxin [Agrobacterium sp. a22-2]|nr:BrnT family toxin [Agrobacterium sp. a22-2]